MTAGMPIALVERGGATWGMTPEEALANLETVVKMVVASLAEHGEPIAETAPSGSVEVSTEPLVAVTV
jgi:predicted RNase H-like HicB family nuclease